MEQLNADSEDLADIQDGLNLSGYAGDGSFAPAGGMDGTDGDACLEGREEGEVSDADADADAGDDADPAVKYGLDCAMPKRGRFRYWCYRFVKRALDIICSALVMIVFCWLYLILAICVKCGDKGPVIYRHTRVGKGGKEFKVPKFRTMIDGADNLMKSLTFEERKRYMAEFKLEDDPRITKVGKFLRKSSLDELPNVWKIFIGKMSVVGPRPLMQNELDEKYGSAAGKLVSVRPGMIGWWSCNGRSLVTYENGERQKLELYYVDHCSLWLDTKVFFKQIWKVILRVGAV